MTTTTQWYPTTSAARSSYWPALFAWAICSGAVSGFSCIGVRFCFLALQWIFVQHNGALPTAATALSPIRRIVTPACGGLLAMLVLRAAHHFSGRADPVDYVDAVRFRGGRIPLLSTVWRTASSACSIATGAAVGREGSMIQVAAAVSSWLAERFPALRFSISRQVACGAAAGVAAAYQAPIAGAFFSFGNSPRQMALGGSPATHDGFIYELVRNQAVGRNRAAVPDDGCLWLSRTGLVGIAIGTHSHLGGSSVSGSIAQSKVHSWMAAASTVGWFGGRTCQFASTSRLG